MAVNTANGHLRTERNDWGDNVQCDFKKRKVKLTLQPSLLLHTGTRTSKQIRMHSAAQCEAKAFGCKELSSRMTARYIKDLAEERVNTH